MEIDPAVAAAAAEHLRLCDTAAALDGAIGQEELKFNESQQQKVCHGCCARW